MIYDNSLCTVLESVIRVAVIFVIVGALSTLIVYKNCTLLLCSKEKFMDTYQVKSDGIRLWNCTYDSSDFTDIKKHQEEEGYYLFKTNAIRPINETSSTQRTCIIVPSDIYNTVYFEELLNVRPMYYYMSVDLRVVPKEGKEPLKLPGYTAKRLMRANDLVFIIGYDNKFIYSEDEAYCKVFKFILENSSNSPITLPKLTNAASNDYTSIPAPEDLLEIEKEATSTVKKFYTNEVTPALIKENWGKSELFLFEDGSTLNIKLNDTVKYIPDETSFVVFKNSNPTEIHYTLPTDKESNVSVNVTNDIAINSTTDEQQNQ